MQQGFSIVSWLPHVLLPISLHDTTTGYVALDLIPLLSMLPALLPLNLFLQKGRWRDLVRESPARKGIFDEAFRNLLSEILIRHLYRCNAVNTSSKSFSRQKMILKLFRGVAIDRPLELALACIAMGRKFPLRKPFFTGKLFLCLHMWNTVS